MIDLKPTLFPSSAVHSIGWEPIKSGQFRGNIHVHFHKDGVLTQRGYFKGAQRAIFLGLEAARKPGAFIHQNLREHFEWVRTDVEDFDAEMRANLDPTLPFVEMVIPASTPNTIEAIQACIDAYRIQPERTGLFE